MDANEKLGKATGTNILNQKYNQYIDLYLLFFQAGLLNKLMHNMGSPFTNTVMPQ